jgi:hypothetical protein
MSIRLLFDIQRVIFTMTIILSGVYFVLYLIKEILYLFKKEDKNKDVIEITSDKIKYRTRKIRKTPKIEKRRSKRESKRIK